MYTPSHTLTCALTILILPSLLLALPRPPFIPLPSHDRAISNQHIDNLSTQRHLAEINHAAASRLFDEASTTHINNNRAIAYNRVQSTNPDLHPQEQEAARQLAKVAESQSLYHSEQRQDRAAKAREAGIDYRIAHEELHRHAEHHQRVFGEKPERGVRMGIEGTSADGREHVNSRRWSRDHPMIHI